MRNLSQYKLPVAFVLFISLVFFLAHSYVKSSQADIRTTLESNLSETHEKLTDSASLIYKNKSNDEVKSFVKDCNQKTRSKFDNYLNKLNNLTPAQLSEAELMLAACGSFFADQKLAMVSVLKSDFESYQKVLGLYEHIDQSDSRLAEKADWLLFIELQDQQANLLKKQVTIQEEIINLLKQGELPGSESVQGRVSEANEISESASVLVRQLDSVYGRLVKGS